MTHSEMHTLILNRLMGKFKTESHTNPGGKDVWHIIVAFLPHDMFMEFEFSEHSDTVEVRGCFEDGLYEITYNEEVREEFMDEFYNLEVDKCPFKDMKLETYPTRGGGETLTTILVSKVPYEELSNEKIGEFIHYLLSPNEFMWKVLKSSK